MGSGDGRGRVRDYVRRHGVSLAVATALMVPAGWLVAVSQHGPYETHRSGGFSYYTTTGDIGYLFLGVFLVVAVLTVLASVFSSLSKRHPSLARFRLVPRTLHLLVLLVYWALGTHALSQVLYVLLR